MSRVGEMGRGCICNSSAYTLKVWLQFGAGDEKGRNREKEMRKHEVVYVCMYERV